MDKFYSFFKSRRKISKYRNDFIDYLNKIKDTSSRSSPFINENSIIKASLSAKMRVKRIRKQAYLIVIVLFSTFYYNFLLDREQLEQIYIKFYKLYYNKDPEFVRIRKEKEKISKVDDKFNMIPKKEDESKVKKIKRLLANTFEWNNKINNSIVLNKNIDDRLENIKGIDEVREELEEVITMLKNPKKYEEAGAKLIKGILLVGKPGTGKTLLARSLAGESGVNFIYTAASEFESKFVGKGSSKLRKLFELARTNSPCVIFIDEIDSLLDKSKRQGKYSSSSERQDINTFLSEMDGFKKNEHVFILGATNSVDSLDEAALRPGRFDKIIHVPIPDKKGRGEIFTIYLDKINLEFNPDVTSTKLSEMTPGFTGAEIQNMVNLATIIAVDKDEKQLSQSLFEEARDRIIMGIKLTSNKNIRYILQRAVHEAGHTLICHKSELCRRDIHKVSIARRGLSEGKTSILPDENFSGLKNELRSYVEVALGGILAEEIYFGGNKISTGCGNDLNKASSIAKDMVKKYAMNSDDFGYMYVDESGYIVDHKISKDTRNTIDAAADNIVKGATTKARELLNENLNELKILTQNLIEYEELDKNDIDNIMKGLNLDDKNILKTSKDKKKVRNVNIADINI